MLYVLKKEGIEHARLRALAQAIIAKDKGKEVFDDYMKVAFPWLDKQKGQEKSGHIQVLMDEVKRGKLGIRPLWENTNSKLKSRLKHKVIEREVPETKPKSRGEMNALYAQLGKVVPV